MSSEGPASITGVRGGSGSVEATYDAMQGLADTVDAAADRQRGWALSEARVLADPDLLASAPLSPLTFAEAEAAVLAATTGPLGLLPGSCAWEATAAAIRAAVVGLEAGDAAVGLAIDQLDWRLGWATGLALRVAGPATAGVVASLPPDERAALGDAAQQWMVDHPTVVQHLVNGGGGLLTGGLLTGGLLTGGLLTGGLLTGRGPLLTVPDRRTATRLLALAYDDGEPRTRLRPDLRTPSTGRQPASVADLVEQLSEVADLSPDPDSADNGTLEVRSLDPGTERARHVVYLPGTDDFATRPGAQDGDIRDLGTDLRSAAGDDTAYQRGILRALADAGVGSDEPVLLVGHSLGGMEAAALAARDTGFAITDVVTAGSPTAQVGDLPDDVRVLSLEHEGDVVPLLDGADNPDSVEQVTVRFAHEGDGTIIGEHGYDHYRAGAAAVDASTDPAVAEQVQGLRDRGFLGGSAEVRSTVIQVVRDR